MKDDMRTVLPLLSLRSGVGFSQTKDSQFVDMRSLHHTLSEEEHQRLQALVGDNSAFCVYNVHVEGKWQVVAVGKTVNQTVLFARLNVPNVVAPKFILQTLWNKKATTLHAKEIVGIPVAVSIQQSFKFRKHV